MVIKSDINTFVSNSQHAVFFNLAKHWRKALVSLKWRVAPETDYLVSGWIDKLDELVGLHIASLNPFLPEVITKTTELKDELKLAPQDVVAVARDMEDPNAVIMAHFWAQFYLGNIILGSCKQEAWRHLRPQLQALVGGMFLARFDLLPATAKNRCKLERDLLKRVRG